MAGCVPPADALGACARARPGGSSRWTRNRSLSPRHGSGLGDAVEAIMLAVRAWVLRFGRDELGPWERAVWLTGGLLHGHPPLPP